MTFIETLQSEQQSRNLTQASFAEFLNVSARTLANWLSGDTEPTELMRQTILAKLSENPNKSTPSDRNTQIIAAFQETEDTLRSAYTAFSATETKAFARLLNLLRDQILSIP